MNDDGREVGQQHAHRIWLSPRMHGENATDVAASDTSAGARRSNEGATTAAQHGHPATGQQSNNQDKSNEISQIERYLIEQKELEYNSDLITRNSELLQESIRGIKRPMRVFNTHVAVADMILIVREMHILQHLADLRPNNVHTLMVGMEHMIKDCLKEHNTAEAEEDRKAVMRNGCDSYTKRDHATTTQFLTGLKLATEEEDWSMWQLGIKTLPEEIFGIPIFNHQIQLFMVRAAQPQQQPLVVTPSESTQADTPRLGILNKTAQCAQANEVARAKDPLGFVQRGLQGTLGLTAPPPSTSRTAGYGLHSPAHMSGYGCPHRRESDQEA